MSSIFRIVRLSQKYENESLLCQSDTSLSRSFTTASSSSSYGAIDTRVKCETLALDNNQDPKKIKRKFSVILVAVLIFMVKDGALGVDNVRDTLELRDILEVSIEEKRNISISDEDFPMMISDAQIELLFLAFGFTISAVLLAVSSTTVICLLGTLAAVLSISLSLLFLNLDNFARFEGG